MVFFLATGTAANAHSSLIIARLLLALIRDVHMMGRGSNPGKGNSACQHLFQALITQYVD